MSSMEVDDAMRRAEADQGRAGHDIYAVACGQAVADRYFLANEVKRLREQSVHAPVAMYGKAGREPICDFDCDYCRQGDE